ncbi:uncharacterized protein SRCM100169_02785 [Bacillus siamensis]|uniref:YgaB family protein n=1 Tax=Bacillus siamensis TaxID=659243 RepID=UPI0007EA49AD|nr:YgaB family protein [Bacillus siamensis]OAZ59934.1 uncharacterized protein SRCM100169_02785 [Bacillus siamensis]
MSEFEKLVSEQMKIMDQLLELQSELDRCRQVEAELISLERDTKLDNVQDEIATKRKDLAGIQELFQRQTEQVIQSYRNTEKPSSYVQK